MSRKTQKRPTLARRGAKGSEGRTNPAKGPKEGTSGQVGGDRLHVESWPIVRVKPYARNPRKNAPAVQKVAASIQAFGFRQPIVVDPKGVIIAGHTRLLAALHLGLKDVPVHVANGLTEAQVKAYRLADNRTAEEAEWDTDLLGQEFADLQALDFDLSLTGFEPNEIAVVQHSGLAPGVDPDAVPDLPKQPISREGDLIQLGPHRLLCGDATNPHHVELVLGGIRPTVIYTDPPYGNAYSGKGITASARGHNFGPISGDDSPAVAGDAFVLAATLDVTLSVWWGANYYCDKVPAGYAWLVWDKEVVGDVYSAAEMAWTNQKGRIRMFRHQWHGMVKASEYGKSRVHPTQKPVALVEWVFEELSAGDTVLDLFAGSGSTLVACERTARTAYLMEIDPRYCDVIVARWENATGQTAVRPKVAA